MRDIDNPSIPFEVPLQGFPQNSEVIVSGRSMKGREGVFVVEFAAGRDIVLHLSFRYKTENILVINSFTNGSWQHEERHQNPVYHEQSFLLQIENKPGHFIIWQKNHKMEFRHRMDPMMISSMRIYGDVSIDKIKFERFGLPAGYANSPYSSNVPPNGSPYSSTPQGPYGTAQPFSGVPSHQAPYNVRGPPYSDPFYSSNPRPNGPPQRPYSNAPTYSYPPSSQSGQYPTGPNVYGNPPSSHNNQYIGYGTSQNPNIGGGVGFNTATNIGGGTAPNNSQIGRGIGFESRPSFPPNNQYPRPR